MTEISTLKTSHVRSAGTANPIIDLFDVPDTDVSIAGYRMVTIQPFTTGITPVVFQIDAQSDYVDLNRSYFEVEINLKKTDGNQLVVANDTFPANNFGHTLFKQIMVKFNNVLMTASADTYHYKAMIETLLNYDRDDGDTILRPQGWYNGINCPATLTRDNTDYQAPHADYQNLSKTQQDTIQAMVTEAANYTNTTILRFKPCLEVFHLNKLLVPGIQIDMNLYFNNPNLFMNGHANAFRLNPEDVKVRFHMCTVRLNPGVYLKLEKEMSGRVPTTYPVVRSEIRTFNMPATTMRFEESNLFFGRVPNRMVVGMVLTTAFTGTLANDPFAFQKWNLQSIKQTVNNEEYPYETLEMNGGNARLDGRGYHRFLQATGALLKSKGSMIRRQEWGRGANKTLFVFDNAANGCLDSPVFNPKLSGDVRLLLQFSTQLGSGVTLIVYGEFENTIEINGDKSVIYDIYER